MPGAMKLAADAMEMTTDELYKLIESGGLAAEDFLPKFAKETRKFAREGGALGKMLKGTRAEMGRFGNAIDDAAIAFSKGGFKEGFVEFLREATSMMNSMIKSGFFDALGFGFRMLMIPIRATMEVVGGLSDIFKRASEEGGQYKDILTKIAIVLGVLFLPALLSIGAALAPFTFMVAGLLAMGDIMQGLAGNSSEFKTNWDKLTESIKNGKTDWDALKSVLAEVGIALAGIVTSAVMLNKINPFKSKAAAVVGGTAVAATGSGFVAKTLGFISKAVRSPIMALQSDKLGEGSDQIYDANGNLKAEYQGFTPDALANRYSPNPDLPMFGANNRIDNLNRVGGASPSLPMFDANNKMMQETRRLPSSYASSSSSSSQSVIISNMNINGESAPENLRTNMESYMNGLLGDVFTDAMRETVR